MILVDTGVIYASIDRKDPDHQDAARVLDEHSGELLSPTPIIVESSWMIEDRLGPVAEAGFLRGVTGGELTRIDLTEDDWDRCIDLIDTYADLGLGLADASIITVAERLTITTIATLNHRDFRVVRPTHCDAFELIP